MNDIRSFFNTFLQTINYPDNKDEFIENMVKIIYLETINELIETLPQDKQPLIIQSLESANTPELLLKLVNSTFNQDVFNKTLTDKTTTVFTEYLQTIDNSITETQKIELGNLSPLIIK